MTSPSITGNDRLSDAADVGAVTLHVADLDLVLRFYHEGVGLDVLSHSGDEAVLGRTRPTGLGEVVVILKHAPRLARAAQGAAGLYHTAILFSQQSALASAVYSVARAYPTSFTGSADHLVSQAFYFTDPEGNGVELYWDRPREEWSWQDDGQVAMGTLALDPNAFLREHLSECGAEHPERGDTTVGHVHLQVGDIARAEAFYIGLVGFEPTLRYGDSASFVSAGRYHHHIGMNTWHSLGAGRRSPALGLGQVSVHVPTDDEVLAIQARLTAAGVATAHDGRVLHFDDPWANSIQVTAD